ncbi:MAG: aldo/keto reductase [Oscillospiraceae bacterium]|nr:aldo/keto reductase [Oscillospiraceae bacterium]
MPNSAFTSRVLSEKGTLLPPRIPISGVETPASRIFFGTATPPMLADEDCTSLLDAVYASGINAFDTARGYQGAEKALGRWMKARGNRDKLVILTKCGDLIRGKVHIDREVILREFAQSLENLGTDHVDIFLLHRDDPNTPILEQLETLNELKRAGKMRVFGVSNWTHARIAEANRIAAEHGLEGFTVSSPNFGLAHQMADLWGGGCVTLTGRENADARRWYTENQMPVVAYSSLARGFFSGKFRAYDQDGAKQVLDSFAQKGFLYDENMERLRIAEEIAARDGCTVSQVALRYLFASPMNTFAVVSTTNPDRLADNAACTLAPLGETDLVRFDRI